MAEMVWCQSCNTVVWAYDHQPRVDVRGLMNLMKMPCPLCGAEGNFDGWGSNHPLVYFSPKTADEVYDAWSVMRYIAKCHKVRWDPSKDNQWFRR